MGISDVLNEYRSRRDSLLSSSNLYMLKDDEEWVKNEYLMPTKETNDEYEITKRFRTITEFKFTDTSLGGNVSLNCYPQFTRYADVKPPRSIIRREDVSPLIETGNHGMGIYYGETIDDNSINVFFEFGTPEFNNLLYYLMSASDYRMAVVANKARSPIAYTAGETFGTIALFLAFPLVTGIALLLKTGFEFLTSMGMFNGRFDYYYLKPSMFLYWSVVNSLVNTIATELGLLTPILDNNADKTKVGLPAGPMYDEIEKLRELFPGLIISHNAINIHAVISKTQMRYAKYRRKQYEVLKRISDGQIDDKTKRYEELLEELSMKYGEDVYTDYSTTLWDKLKDKGLIKDKDLYGYKDEKDTSDISEFLSKIKNKTVDGLKELFNPEDGRPERDLRPIDKSDKLTRAYDIFKTILDEGARYAVFRVEYPGSPSESFSNSVTTVDLADNINNLNKKWKSFKFNLAGGEIPLVSDVMSAVSDFALGTLSGISLGFTNVVGSFLAGVNLEVPKRWEDSSASFPTLSFKMSLISPSAHPIAQLTNIYIPLAAILAGALPLSTGPRSYTAPFHCSMFVKGYQRITLGMITEVNITRGTSNLPFNKLMKPLAVDVTFTVTDFSEIVHAPVPTSVLSMASVIYDNESGISKYLQALCGRDLFSATHFSENFKINLSNFLKNLSVEFDSATIGAKIGDMMSSNLLFSLFNEPVALGYNDNRNFYDSIGF